MHLTEVSLFDLPPRFDGPGLTLKDLHHLSGQLAAVYELMRDGEYRSLRAIAATLGGVSEAGVSARLRDLRKPRFGKHEVVRRRVGDTRTYEYKLIIKESSHA